MKCPVSADKEQGTGNREVLARCCYVIHAAICRRKREYNKAACKHNNHKYRTSKAGTEEERQGLHLDPGTDRNGCGRIRMLTSWGGCQIRILTRNGGVPIRILTGNG